MGLQHGEIRGPLWENHGNEEIQSSRSIWNGAYCNGRMTAPKTRKRHAPVSAIRQFAERLEMHRLLCGNPQTGPVRANAKGKPRNIIIPRVGKSPGAESLRALRKAATQRPSLKIRSPRRQRPDGTRAERRMLFRAPACQPFNKL